MLIYFFILFILGTFFGSFSTVLISRWKEKKPGIMLGRSECPNCLHRLSALELIPIVSWISQGGQCKNCKKNISTLYPLSEIFMGILFVWSGYISLGFGYSWIDVMWWIFLFWMFVTGVYVLYDMRYMEIPDEIVVPGIIITILLLLLHPFYIDSWVFYDYYGYQDFHTFLTDHISAAILLYSFFFIQILIPGTIFLVQQKKYTHIVQLFISYITFPVITIFDFFYKKNENTINQENEIPGWIGGGDLRLAWFIGLTLGSIHTFFAVIFAYIIGSIVGISIITYARYKNHTHIRQIAFGPFLGIGWILALTFYHEIIGYIQYMYQ